MEIIGYKSDSDLFHILREFNPYEREGGITAFDEFDDPEECEVLPKQQDPGELSAEERKDARRLNMSKEVEVIATGIQAYCSRIGSIALSYLSRYKENKRYILKKCTGFALSPTHNPDEATGFYKKITILFQNRGETVVEIEIIVEDRSQNYRLFLKEETTGQRTEGLSRYRFSIEPGCSRGVEVYRQRLNSPVLIPTELQSLHFLTVKVIEFDRDSVARKTSTFLTRVIAHKENICKVRHLIVFNGNLLDAYLQIDDTP